MATPKWKQTTLGFSLPPRPSPSIVSTRIVGGPGAGKTQYFLDKILELRNGVLPKENILAVMFNRDARKSFTKRCKLAGIKNVQVVTFHKLCVDLHKAFTGRSCTIAIVRELALKLMKSDEAKTRDHFKGVSLCIVDEAQDMNSADNRLVRALETCLRCPVWLGGDPMQSIYAFQGSCSRYFSTYPVQKEVVLDKSYRCTEEILHVINALRPGLPMTSATHRRGQIPTLLQASDDTICLDIVSQIRDALDNNQSIAIIGPSKKQGATNYGLNNMEILMRRNGIQYIRHYHLDNSSESKKRNREEVEGNPVHIYTIHGSKGLEFDVVLLIDLHEHAHGLIRTSAKETEMRNLWHVGVSRARTKLAMYARAGVQIWKDARLFWDRIRLLQATPMPQPRNLSSEENRIPGSWAEILTSSLLMEKDETMYRLSQEWDCSASVLQDAQGHCLEGEHEDLLNVITVFAKNTLEHAYRGGEPHCVSMLRILLENMIEVSSIPSSARHVLRLTPLSLSTPEDVRNAFAGRPDIEAALNKMPTAQWIHVYTPVASKFFDPEVLRPILEKAEWAADDMWRISLFLYQYEHHGRVLWEDHHEYSDHLGPLNARIREFASQLPDGFRFQVHANWTMLPIEGQVDMINDQDRRIVEIKYSKSKVSEKLENLMQVLGYREMLAKQDVSKYTCEIWNLSNMELLRVDGSVDPERRWKIYTILSRCLESPLARPVFLYDLETQGLEVSTTGIVEIHVEEMRTGIVPLSTLVYQDDAGATEVHNIKTEDLFGCPTERMVAQALQEALAECGDQIVLMAHNGHCFDHPIVRRSLLSGSAAGSDIKWHDSMNIFRAMTGHGKLEDAYRETHPGRDLPVNQHRAAGDVKMMQSIMRALNIDADTLYIDRNE